MRARCDWDDQGQRLVDADRDRPGSQIRAAERAHLVGQAHRDQRAAGAFGAVLERRRDTSAGHRQAKPARGAARGLAQLVVERDADPLAALGVIDRALLDPVAVLFEQQRLQTDLDALGLVCAARDVGPLAALVIDGGDDAVLGLGDVDPGDHAEPLRRERDRAAGGLLPVLLERLGGRQRRARPVDTGMDAPPVHGVAGLRPLALPPHQVGEARAIDEFVHHPRRNQRRLAARRRRRKRELELGAAHRRGPPGALRFFSPLIFPRLLPSSSFVGSGQIRRDRENSRRFRPMPKRQGANPKRRIVPAGALDPAVLARIEGEARYTGSAHHKRRPADYGFHPPANPRPHKSLCDGGRSVRLEEAKALFREGVRWAWRAAFTETPCPNMSGRSTARAAHMRPDSSGAAGTVTVTSWAATTRRCGVG